MAVQNRPRRGSLRGWAGIANTQMNEMAALWGHVQFEARRRWREVDTPAGRIPVCCRPAGTGDLTMPAATTL